MQCVAKQVLETRCIPNPHPPGPAKRLSPVVSSRFCAGEGAQSQASMCLHASQVQQRRRACMTPSQLASIAMLMSLPVRQRWPT